MKFCMPHWTSLKAAVAARGLDKFVARDGEEAAKRLVGENETDAKNFDPLMGAHNAILSNVMATPVGLDVMMPNEDGSERCPLCYVAACCPCGAADCKARWDSWIDRAADDQLEAAKSLGLLASG